MSTRPNNWARRCSPGMKIDPNPRKTKTKQYRTDEEYLQMLSDRHPVVGTDPRIPRPAQAAFDLRRSAAATDQSADRTHPHLVQPGRYRNRAAQFDEPEPAKHPGARRTGPRDPQGVRTVGRRTPAAVGRLFADRTAADGALERRRDHDRRLRARCRYPHGDRRANLPASLRPT